MTGKVEQTNEETEVIELADAPGKWVPTREAVALVSDVYHKAMGCDYPTARNAAISAIKRDVRTTLSLARGSWFDTKFDETGEMLTNDCISGLIPYLIWSNLESANHVFTEDWVAGYLDFELEEEAGARRVVIYSMEFHEPSLPMMQANSVSGTLNAHPTQNLALQQRGAMTPSLFKGSRGRTPANWWPDFAEELARDLYDDGYPETQEALIDRVFSKIIERGKPEPSRTSVQPVIRALYASRT